MSEPHGSVCGGGGVGKAEESADAKAQPTQGTALRPVCGMQGVGQRVVSYEIFEAGA